MEVDSRIEVPLQSISMNKPGQAGSESIEAMARNNRLKAVD